MSLLSNGYLLFAVLTAAVYYLLPKRLRWCGLLVMSLYYYAAGGVRYLLCLLFSAGITWGLALLIEKTDRKRRRKALLILGLLLNFGLLGIVKYQEFLPHFNGEFLPLGISFYVFQTAGYLIDASRGEIRAEKNPARYLLFASFFPQMVQGPISRWKQLSPQLFEGNTFAWENVSRGIERIVWGMFRKLVIADWAAVFADPVFAQPDKYRPLTLFAVLFYSIQIYANFAGGIDIVIGTAELFGIRLEENFTRPYFASSIGDFWRRWHRTLSFWLRDYVYIPLGGSRGGTLLTCQNLLVTFLISGIWHGTNWTYLVWGLLHGVSQCIGRLTKSARETLYKRSGLDQKKWFSIGQRLCTFALVSLFWIFFRAESLSAAAEVCKGLFCLPDARMLLTIPAGRGGLSGTPAALAALAAGTLLVFRKELQEERNAVQKTEKTAPAALRFLVSLLLFLAAGAFGSTALVKGFIYAQF